MAKVKHIALLKFKDGVTSEQIAQLFDAVLEITESIDGIEDYVSGTNISNEGFSQGYTHGFVMTFHDVAARDAYLGHPEHERIKGILLELMANGIVFDFEL
jgi:Stress responsive A/B Barrel Domain